MDLWLITGSAGFLGTNAAVFLGGKASVVGQARFSMASPHMLRVIPLDLRNTPKCAQLIRDLRPNVILHAAAVSGHETAARHPQDAYSVNVAATAAIADAAGAVGARLVHISTDAVFSGDLGNYSETDPVQPFSVYGETKLAGESAVRDALEDHLIVRTNFFGWSETGSKSVLEFFVNSLRAGREVRGYPNFRVTSIYVQELMESIWDLCELGVTGTFNVASSNSLSKFEFGVGVAKRFGLDAGLISKLGPVEGSHIISRARDLSLDTTLVSTALGRPMPTQERGIDQAAIDEPLLTQALRHK